MIERPEPLENPAEGGDSPGDTNALLDELRDGKVVKLTSDLSDVYFQLVGGARIHRVSFAGTPPAVRKLRPISPVEFAARVSDRMRVGRGDIELTTPEELDQRERAHDVALAFAGIRRLERQLARERGDDDDN